jgi:hypothetical protein
MRCQHEILLRGNDNEMVQAELEQPSQSGTRQARDIQQNSGKPEDMQITTGKLPSSSSVTPLGIICTSIEGSNHLRMGLLGNSKTGMRHVLMLGTTRQPSGIFWPIRGHLVICISDRSKTARG